MTDNPIHTVPCNNNKYILVFLSKIDNLHIWGLYKIELRIYAEETRKEVLHFSWYISHCCSDICLKGIVVNKELNTF